MHIYCPVIGVLFLDPGHHYQWLPTPMERHGSFSWDWDAFSYTGSPHFENNPNQEFPQN